MRQCRSLKVLFRQRRCIASEQAVTTRCFAAQAQPAPTAPEHQRDGKVFHPDLLNADFVSAQYAVRGELYLKGEELRKAGKEIIFTNVGNPQVMGQKPLKFNRQVLSLVSAPFLLEHPKVGEIFPSDAIARAKQLLAYAPGGVGAYSDSRGIEGVRREVAEFIERRDGHPSNPEHIFLADGASAVVKYVLNALLRDRADGVAVPVPQYPLYSSSIELLGGSMVGYQLDEDSNWGLDIDYLRKRLQEARDDGIATRALAFINPGNPTGQCLSYDNIRDLIKFAHEERIALLADEVYQDNIYQDERPFVSAKKVLKDMGGAIADEVELVSFHTVSKGVTGECGLRGGYMELTNIHPGAIDEMYKIASISLCPNVVGQMAVSLLVNPPKQSDESYESLEEEKTKSLASLRRRAEMVTKAFNDCEGITCNYTEGAMYSFPRLHLPNKALEAAKADGKAPDTWYCLKLLEETGILTVPGSGFGQAPGTFHLRTTILPPEEKIQSLFFGDFQKFHSKFMEQYK